MVVDDIKNASIYFGLGPCIKAALEYLMTTDFSAMQPWKYELDNACFAIVQDYITQPQIEKRWEAHRKYIDIQFIADGEELIGHAHVEDLHVIEEYDEANDIEWFEGEGNFIKVRKGTFMILYPTDAHMPGVEINCSDAVRKVVVKIPV